MAARMAGGFSAPQLATVDEMVEAGIPPTGEQMFNHKSHEEQDEMLGPQAANAVRSGLVTLDQLKGESELAEGENFITQRPLSDLT
jgi:hypothetical protein